MLRNTRNKISEDFYKVNYKMLLREVKEGLNK